MGVKRKLFYDACICIDAARGNICATEWARVSKFVSKTFEYYISPLTLDELLRGIRTGAPKAFLRNQRALQLLYPAHRKHFLPPPGDFIFFKLFGTKTPAWPTKSKMEAVFKAFLQCRSAEELCSKQIWKGKPDTAFSELLWTSNWYSRKEVAYATDWGSNRDRTNKSLDADEWVRMLLKHFKQPDTLANRQLAQHSLSAQLAAVQSLWNARKDAFYNFLKHSSDLVDEQQLAYLADPNMIYVTNDRKLRLRIGVSPQSSRVWNWQELRKDASIQSSAG